MVARWYGLELAIYGMGLVFLLLAVLSGFITILVRFDRPPAPADEPATEAQPGAAPAPTVRGDIDGVEVSALAAVVIACRAHRMTRRKQAAPEMRTHEPGTLPSRWIGSGRTRQNRSWAPRGRFA